jgi:hypothetical protein
MCCPRITLGNKGGIDLSGVRIEAVCALPCASASVPVGSQVGTAKLESSAIIYLRFGIPVALWGNDMWGGAEGERLNDFGVGCGN